MDGNDSFVHSRLVPASLLCLLFLSIQAFPADRNHSGKPRPRAEAEIPTETLASRTRSSIVVISHFDRDGKEDGVGAGFVVARDGLIATSLHVIGEGRAVKVQLSDGKSYDVKEIYAWDRKLDLAVIRVAATNLQPLALGDSDTLKQGAAVIAIGNPLGLKHSVVQGVVSARRDFDGLDMIQLAIPIEPGNSGGPLLDVKGRVHGLLTMKSAMTANLGFAVPINELKPLLSQPNPISMERWTRLGALNTNEWSTLFGARWTQKGGRIFAESPGTGFGGRSLCLWNQFTPARPYELMVTVRLDDEAGAAGLVFGSDRDQKHYGFYPSAGQLRLTRFDGPNVFSWTILNQAPSAHYRPGDWNTLKVRREQGKILCFVNDHLVVESTDDQLPDGSVGLAKFRDTRATFKNFQVGTNLAPVTASLTGEIASAVSNVLEGSASGTLADLGQLGQPQSTAAQKVLMERATQLEQKAGEMRRLAAALRRQSVERQLAEALKGPEAKIDLFYAALLVARFDNPDLEVDIYRQQLGRMAGELGAKIKPGADESARLKALQDYFFVENGFHGSRSDYYNRANSYVNEVLDEREGIPITLAVVFIELAQRIGLNQVVGLPVPGHFMVKYAGPDEQIIDVFREGKIVTREEIDELVQESTGAPVSEAHLRPAKKREIIARMLRNLHASAQRTELGSDSGRYLDLIIALWPESAIDRLDRARLRLQAGDRTGARQDFKWLLDNDPPGINMERVAEALQSL